MRQPVAYLAVGFCGLALLGYGMFLYVQKSAEPFIYAAADAPPAQAVMILGASVTSGGELSPVLKDRADKALELYHAGTVKKILVTGDNSTLSHNEVNPVGMYLLKEGIPKDDIFLDHAGFDTYSSVYRARDVFMVQGVAIVSQEFHLPRAVYAARALGLQAYGIHADTEGRHLYNYAREIPASIKAVLDVSFRRVPKYLGARYPIEGAGASTWYAEEEVPDELVVCTADAKQCPDGSYVGRTGPHCEFAPCPGS